MTPFTVLLLTAIVVLLCILVFVRQSAKRDVEGLHETLKHSTSFREETEKARKKLLEALQAQTAATEFHRSHALEYAEDLLSKRIRVAKRKDIEQFLKQSNKS